MAFESVVTDLSRQRIWRRVLGERISRLQPFPVDNEVPPKTRLQPESRKRETVQEGEYDGEEELWVAVTYGINLIDIDIL